MQFFVQCSPSNKIMYLPPFSGGCTSTVYLVIYFPGTFVVALVGTSEPYKSSSDEEVQPPKKGGKFLIC